MSSKIVEIIVAGLTGPIQILIEEKVEEALKKLQAHDAVTYKAALQGLYIGAGQLERVTDKTRTKLDDAVVDALLAACEASAEEFEVELPQPRP